jgi:hypothetical protein
MKSSHILLGAALLVIGGLCGSIESGFAQQPTSHVTQVAYGGQGMGHRAKEGLRDTTDALGITPAVKEAIIADAQLNDRRNHINVGTKDYVLHLTGHVYSRAVKARAGRVAANKLARMHKRYRVINELSITR